jgi:hypothetical protein
VTKEEIKTEIRKYIDPKEDENNLPKLMDCSKSSMKREVHTDKCLR